MLLFTSRSVRGKLLTGLHSCLPFSVHQCDLLVDQTVLVEDVRCQVVPAYVTLLLEVLEVLLWVLVVPEWRQLLDHFVDALR